MAKKTIDNASDFDFDGEYQHTDPYLEWDMDYPEPGEEDPFEGYYN